MKVCLVADCGRAVKARGLCGAHLYRLTHHGDVQADIPVKVWRYAKDAICREAGCGERPRQHGWCDMHRMRWYRSGELGPAEHIRPGPKAGTCEIPGCTDAHYGRGWCRKHYRLWHEYGDPFGGVGRWRTADVVSAIRADLRQAMAMRAHGRRRDVAYLVERARSHGQPLSKVEEGVAGALIMAPDAERDRAQLQDDVVRLSAKRISADEAGVRLGVSDRTIVRYRTKAKKLENQH